MTTGAMEGILSTVRKKNQITAVDHKEMSITHTVFEGYLTVDYPSFDITIDVTPIHEGWSNKSMVKWSFKFEKENEHVPAPTSFLKFFEAFLKNWMLSCWRNLRKKLIKIMTSFTKY
ncbi:hypothetical protein MKX03_006105 [Papaver bracteatum]|nr:hypothetical protein MKX03_006105 [Papaver bracteatum]